MIKSTRGLLAIALFVPAVAAAQVPAHEQYVEQYPEGYGFYKAFTEWDENDPSITGDDNFYVSRVRPAERFTDPDTQVDPQMTADRKLLWWCPAGVANSYWSSLPRYIFNADAFSAWAMIDVHGNWADGVGRVPGALSDAAHRNGVQNGCIFFWDSNFASSDAKKWFQDLAKTDANGDYYNVRKFVRFMKHYGLDGIGINPESGVGSTFAGTMQTVLEKIHEIAIEEGWHFRVDWYDAQTNGGYTSWANQLGSNNSNWFQRQDKAFPVSDIYFLNYNWGTSHLRNSVSTAQGLGRSSFDVYAGFDIQGRGLASVSGGSAGMGWELLPRYDISIGIWGAHGKNIIYENSNEYGSDALSIQTLYQKKQEQFFWSGTRNVADRPAVTNTITSFGSNQMRSFHGVSSFLTARSVLSSLPFVTYFNLGNGPRFYNKGVVSFDREWYNLGVQDMLPTWRWWITDAEGNVPAQAIEAALSYADAWNGGSVLTFSGQTPQSVVRLFKTQFDVAADNEVTLRYKRTGNGNGVMKLMWSADGQTLQTREAPLSLKGEWAELTLKASELGMTGKVKMLGLVFENTEADFAVEIGEMSIRDDKPYEPFIPELTRSEMCGQFYNSVDFKLIWNCLDAPEDKPWEPVYNDQVETWYFEVYAQYEGGEPFLVTTTSSWAAYVVGIPMSGDLSEKVRCGVCAVAPDGLTRSEISWTDYQQRSEQGLTISDAVVVDKAVIKPGEQFTVGFEDPFHANARFQIVSAAKGTVVAEESGVCSLTSSIDELGVYDVVVDGVTFPGLISISPLSTGAVPVIADLTVDKEQALTGEQVTATLTVERLGEGKVSRGLVVEDPTMLRFSPAMCETPGFTMAFWIKPTAFAHGKYGTNLFNKRDWSGSWPHNNWGTIWMHIWPDVPVYAVQNPNIISLTTYSNNYNAYSPIGTYPNGNPHESPNMTCCGNDLSLAVGTWYHVAFSISNTEMSLFLNGKKVATQTVTWRGLNTQNGCTAPQYCYIGGTNTYHGGFIGLVDDVQYWDIYTSNADDFLIDAMQGFSDRDIPEHLMGYWDFEDAPVAGTSFTENGVKKTAMSKFKNLGHNAALEAETMFLEGASGENPDEASTFAKFVDADNNVGGNPNLPGSIDVLTTTSWLLPGDATDAPEGNTNTVTFESNGEKAITARLANTWGSDERTVDVLINWPDAVSTLMDTETTLRYSDEGLTALFAKAGRYTLYIYSIDGRLTDRQTVNVTAGEIVRLKVSGQCVVKIAGQTATKTLKVVK